MIRNLLLLLGLWFCWMPAQALELNRIQVVGLMKNTAVLLIDGQQRLLKVGKTSTEGVTLVSADTKSAVIKLNGVEHRLLLSRAPGNGGYQQQQEVSVSVAINQHGQYFTAGSIDGQPVQFLVDTGATSVAMNTEHARRLGIDFTAGKVGTSATAGGFVKAYSVMLERVKVGELEVKNVRAAVLEGSFPLYILLGMSYLKHVEISENNGILKLSRKY